MRLIDANALIDKYVVVIGKDADEKLTTKIAVLLKDIEEQPTIDAEPVRHGKWEPLTFINAGNEEYTMHRCSECGLTIVTGWYHYCPNCGARMDKE